jgi:hypothetical protein
MGPIVPALAKGPCGGAAQWQWQWQWQWQLQWHTRHCRCPWLIASNADVHHVPVPLPAYYMVRRYGGTEHVQQVRNVRGAGVLWCVLYAGTPALHLISRLATSHPIPSHPIPSPFHPIPFRSILPHHARLTSHNRRAATATLKRCPRNRV